METAYYHDLLNSNKQTVQFTAVENHEYFAFPNHKNQNTSFQGKKKPCEKEEKIEDDML